MTEKEYKERRESLERRAERQASKVHAGSISPLEWQRRGGYFNQQLMRLKEEYSKSKEKEVEEYFGE